VTVSVGIEMDAWTLEEYGVLKAELEAQLKKEGLLPPPDNIFLFHGDSTDERVHEAMAMQTGFGVEKFDVFYTYLVMHEEFAALLAEKAKRGSFFVVYGFDKIMPRYRSFTLLRDMSPMEGILALYQKD
jgi:hypothetical protein